MELRNYIVKLIGLDEVLGILEKEYWRMFF